METARSVFHAQLSSVLDSLIANAVSEIAKIFESSLSQHQEALLQKTNEISVLRAELEKVQGKCAEKSTNTRGSGDQTVSEHAVKQEQDMVDISDQDHGLCQNTAGVKVEPQSLEEAFESRLECQHNGLPSNPPSAAIQVSQIQLIQPIELLSSVQCKEEALDWDENILSEAQLHKEVAPSVQSISPKVRSDTSQTEEWEPGLSSTHESTMENSKANKSNSLEESAPSSYAIAQSVQRRDCGLTAHTKLGSTLGESSNQPQSSIHVCALRNIESLTHHLTASLNGHPNSCSCCGKSFTSSSHQQQHLLRHTGVQLNLCQACEKRFQTPTELTIHSRTHTKDRPFGCGQCGRHFARSRNLKAHHREVHLGKKPFACSECGKRFAHKGNLRVHNHRVHYGLVQVQQSQIGSNSVQ